MVSNDDIFCPYCGGQLKHYDNVKRFIRSEFGKKEFIFVERRYCTACGRVHRVIPNDIYPYKQYRANIINDFVNGVINDDNLEYEDYPCEMTVKRWKKSR